jgi:hypothetical protein
VTGEEPAAGRPGEVGLCRDCRWTRRVTGPRGAEFVLCRRAEVDPAFARYPRLPRLVCPGHEPRAAAAPDA